MLSAHCINNTSKTFSKFLPCSREILFQDFYYILRIWRICVQYITQERCVYRVFTHTITWFLYVFWLVINRDLLKEMDTHIYRQINAVKSTPGHQICFFGCSKHPSKFSLKSKTSQPVKNKSHTTRLRLVHDVAFVLYMLGYYLWSITVYAHGKM